jgi:hypothetical protein
MTVANQHKRIDRGTIERPLAGRSGIKPTLPDPKFLWMKLR